MPLITPAKAVLAQLAVQRYDGDRLADMISGSRILSGVDHTCVIGVTSAFAGMTLSEALIVRRRAASDRIPAPP